MNYYIMPMAMWKLFHRSFQKNLSLLDVEHPRSVMKKAEIKYKSIIRRLPPWGKNDVLLTSLLSAAGFASIYLSLPEKREVALMEKYYRQSMNDNKLMQFLLKKSDIYSPSYQNRLARNAKKSHLAKHPFTWRYRFYYGKSQDTYDAVFDKCGICALFKALKIPEVTAALCAYDYEMAKHTGTHFTRRFTLASGGKVCDCHYRKI